MKAETLEATVEAWTKEPEKAKGAPVVTARADDGQAVIEAGPFTWRADLPPALGGANQAPSPTALLLGALAGCAVVFVRDTLGPQLGVRVDAVGATVRCETDARGLLGIGGAAPTWATSASTSASSRPTATRACRRSLTCGSNGARSTLPS